MRTTNNDAGLKGGTKKKPVKPKKKNPVEKPGSMLTPTTKRARGGGGKKPQRNKGRR